MLRVTPGNWWPMTWPVYQARLANSGIHPTRLKEAFMREQTIYESYMSFAQAQANAAAAGSGGMTGPIADDNGYVEDDYIVDGYFE